MPAGKIEFHNAYWRDENLPDPNAPYEGATVEIDLDNTNSPEDLEVNVHAPDGGIVSLLWDDLVAAVCWLRAYETREEAD